EVTTRNWSMVSRLCRVPDMVEGRQADGAGKTIITAIVIDDRFVGSGESDDDFATQIKHRALQVHCTALLHVGRRSFGLSIGARSRYCYREDGFHMLEGEVYMAWLPDCHHRNILNIPRMCLILESLLDWFLQHTEKLSSGYQWRHGR